MFTFAGCTLNQCRRANEWHVTLVQLNVVATIDPGPASLAFALSVIFTMLSAQAFDPRQIWDGIEAEARAELGSAR